MFIFNLESIAILAPTFLLWGLILVARKKLLDQVLKPYSQADWISSGLANYEYRATLRLYSFCIVLSGLLLVTFMSWNFRSAPSEMTYESVFAVLTFIAGNLALSVAIVLPLFCCLENELNDRLANSLIPQAFTRWQRICKVLAFCSLALILAPAVMAIFVSAGVCPVPQWLARDSFFLGVALSTLPSSAFGMTVSLLRPLVARDSMSKRLKELASLEEFVTDTKFDVPMLTEKSDAELSDIIDLARLRGQFEKADVLSQALLARHFERAE